jgi:general secretion pathway protein D
VRTELRKLGVIAAVAVLALGCTAGRAFRAGSEATRAGDHDQAVAFYRTAVQASPDNPNYKIALERAMQAASRVHFEQAREFEAADQLEAARGEYRLAADYDASNRTAASKVVALDQILRQRAEAARPRPAIEQLRERARAAAAPPILNPTSREPLQVRANNSSARDLINFVGSITGVNVTYDRELQDRPITLQLDGVTLEQALNQIMTMAGFSYKVLAPQAIFVFPDTQQKHVIYDDQVIQTFYVSHADATDLSQILSAIIRLPGIPIQPIIQVNKANNTITIRASTAVAQILERLIATNDKPKAEIVIDVEILEVNRARVKQYGLNLSEYALGVAFSPEVSPGSTTTPTPTPPPEGTPTQPTTSGRSTPPSGLTSPPPFNLNTIQQGVSTSDFYLAVPTFLIRMLESDTSSKVIAKPQLRGAEGSKLTLKLGERIPVIQTSYTPLATGGAGVNPLSSYNYQDVGVNIDLTPRVTLEGDIILDLTLDNSALGAPILVAGVSVPSFQQRTLTTRLRLRDGESNLLAGLLREDERKSLAGFPGAIHVPILKQLFSANDNTINQTDIVMLLTPRIIRTAEITETDLRPIYIGSQSNLGVGGPPSLIGGGPEPDPAALAAAPAAPGVTPAPGTAPGPIIGTAPGGVPIAIPPGSTPVPGTVAVPPPPVPSQPPAAPPGAAVTPDPALAPPAPPAAAPPPDAQVAPGLPPPSQPVTPGPPPPAATPPATSPGVGLAQVVITPPGTTFRMGGGPYTVPISIANAARISTIALTFTFDPALLSVRTVQEGSFMRAGGVNAQFTSNAASPGRVDITITRAADATGATGTGLLGAILLDPVAPGVANMTISGAATGPGGTPMGLVFRPARVTVQP